MEKAPLFVNKKEVAFFIVGLLCAFCLSLSFEYYEFSKIKKTPVFTTNATILGVYKKYSKTGKEYQLLKLRTKHFDFYSFSKPINLGINDRVLVKFPTKQITFYKYLKSFFTQIYSLQLLQKASSDFLHVNVSKQHNSVQMQELFLALFFAKPYSKELRFKISQWGIAHLVAISGFHLGILSTILFFLCKPVYTFFQDKFFPYRNAYADLALVVFILLGIYVYYINVVPSILRAYVMSIVGFLLFAKNIKLLSFSTLFLCIGIILVFFPKLLFSISFFFSVMGVFYIYLFLHYFVSLNKYLVFFLLNFWVYVLMLPVVHYFFEIFTFYQLLSPFISMLFVLFYPIELFLHVIGFGGFFDVWIGKFLEVPMHIYALHVNLWSLLMYLSFSLLAIGLGFLLSLCPSLLCLFFSFKI